MSDLDYTIDGTTPEFVTVDGVDVEEITVDGTRVWPVYIGSITAGSKDFTGNTQYGFDEDDNFGSEATTKDFVDGTIDVEVLKWVDFDSGTDTLDIQITSQESQDFFESIVVETDQGQQVFNTADADNFSSVSGATLWQWNLATKPFTNSNSYDFRLIP